MIMSQRKLIRQTLMKIKIDLRTDKHNEKSRDKMLFATIETWESDPKTAWSDSVKCQY
jgi:hypothetical protein